jgi:hypothetical protein
MRDRVWWVFITILALSCGGPDRKFDSEAKAGADGTSAGTSGVGNVSGRAGTGNTSGDGGSPDSGADAGDGNGGPDLCIGVACTDRPVAHCEGSTQLKTYDAAGSCVDGTCMYTSHQIPCTCAADACETDPCTSISCDMPPPPSCKDDATLTEYAATGSCAVGSCSYPTAGKTCKYGCSKGACLTDPCTAITCDSADQCHDLPGTCDSATGKCSYPNKPDDVACSNVDGNACTADVCKIGVCSAGAAKTCPAPATCHAQGSCNATTGLCSTPNVADHTNCGGNLECLGGACQCTVTSCPNGCCSGGSCKACTPSTVATRTATLNALAISGSQLYFLEYAGSPLVYSLSVNGGTAAMLSYPPPDQNINTIVADGAYVYAGKFGNSIPALLGRMSTAGGAFTTITGSQTWEGTRLLTNTASVFSGSTLSSNYLRAIPKTGGTVVSLISSPAIDYSHFAVDDSFLYFIGANSTIISRIPVAGGDPVLVTSADPNEAVGDLALSGAQVVFVSSTRVARVAAAGGTPSPLTTGAAYSVLADGSAAYFFRAIGGSASCASGTDVFAAPIAGGALRRLATEVTASCIRSPVQDANALYWLAGNVIKKAVK